MQKNVNITVELHEVLGQFKSTEISSSNALTLQALPMLSSQSLQNIEVILIHNIKISAVSTLTKESSGSVGPTIHRNFGYWSTAGQNSKPLLIIQNVLRSSTKR